MVAFHDQPAMRQKRTFLFVNKDSTSKSLSNSRFDDIKLSEINRHVQKARERRLRKRIKIASSTHRLVGFKKVDSSDESSPDHSLSPSSDMVLASSTVSTATAAKPSSDISGTSIDSTRSTKDDDDEVDGEIFSVIAYNNSSAHPYGSPAIAIDSYSGSIIGFDGYKQSVLEYFTTIWMPSTDHIPADCQVTGFTPVWPNDGNLSFAIVRDVLQAPDDISMYSLLSAATRRMQIVNKMTLPHPDLPELYNFKAIQALRKHISLKKPATERLILDLSYLMLAELYVKSPSRSDVYWQMARSLIGLCGGLHKIQAFTAQAALAYDYFIAVGTVTMPALDPFRYPALLGLDSASRLPLHQVRQTVMLRLSEVDPRIRIMSQQSNSLSNTIRAVRSLPKIAVTGITACLRGNIPQLYPVISAPFHPSSRSKSSNGKNSCDVIEADALSVHTRFHAFQIWLWYSSLGFLEADARITATKNAPQTLIREVSKIWKNLDRIQRKLYGSDWALRDDIVLWISAMGLLVATDEADRPAYLQLFAGMAEALDIDSVEKLQFALAIHLPLNHIDSQTPTRLWTALQRDWETSEVLE
jgi:hypothetical protein